MILLRSLASLPYSELSVILLGLYWINLSVPGLFLFVVLAVLVFAIKVGYAALGKRDRTDKEAPFQALPDA